MFEVDVKKMWQRGEWEEDQLGFGVLIYIRTNKNKKYNSILILYKYINNKIGIIFQKQLFSMRKSPYTHFFYFLPNFGIIRRLQIFSG